MLVGTVYTAEIAYDRNYRFIITFFCIYVNTLKSKFSLIFAKNGFKKNACLYENGFKPKHFR